MLRRRIVCFVLGHDPPAFEALQESFAHGAIEVDSNTAAEQLCLTECFQPLVNAGAGIPAFEPSSRSISSRRLYFGNAFPALAEPVLI